MDLSIHDSGLQKQVSLWK